MFNPISASRAHSASQGLPYGQADDDNQDLSYVEQHEHSDDDDENDDNEDEDEDDELPDPDGLPEEGHGDGDDINENSYEDYEDEQSDSIEVSDDNASDDGVEDFGDSISFNDDADNAHSIITEPSDFLLNLSDLLETAHSVLQPFEDSEEQLQNETTIVGRHILSETQRRLYLQRLSIRIVSSVANCLAGHSNARLHDAFRILSLMLPLYFPPPIDPSTLDLKSDAPLLRELSPPRPAPLILIHWLNDYDQHLDSNAFLDVMEYKPNSALHYHFWPLLQKLALRCRLEDLKALIGSAHWDISGPSQPHARTYPAPAARNLHKAGVIIQDIISQCPSLRFFPSSKKELPVSRFTKKNTDRLGEESWDTSSLPWRMWRSKIARAIDDIARISQPDPQQTKKNGEAKNLDEPVRLFRSKPNAHLSAANSNLIPYAIAQEVRIILQIFLGDKETILKASGDWLEGVAGLAAYYDETGSSGDGMEWDKYGRSTTTRATNAYHEGPTKKIAKSFRLATEHAFPLPAVRNLQSAIADVLSGRIARALGFLAKLSLPVASASAEIFGWAGYNSSDSGGKPQPTTHMHYNSLAILGPEVERDDVRERIISKYALTLGSLGALHRTQMETIEGWEVGLAILRRTVTTGTRKAASKLIRSVKLDVDNPVRVERLVKACAKHGLLEDQKHISEAFAHKLLAAGHVGSSLLYFSKAGCNSHIHEVMAGYVRSSLRAGKSLPSDANLDDIMRGLLASPVSLEEDDILRREIAGFAALRSFYTSKNSDRCEESAQTLVVLLLSAGERLDGGLLHSDWESVLTPENIAGLVHELLEISGNDGSGKGFAGHFRNAEIFNILNVIESLFLVGGETLESVQEEFGRVREERRSAVELDFVEAIFNLRSILAVGIGNNWLKEEYNKRLVL